MLAEFEHWLQVNNFYLLYTLGNHGSYQADIVCRQTIIVHAEEKTCIFADVAYEQRTVAMNIVHFLIIRIFSNLGQDGSGY